MMPIQGPESSQVFDIPNSSSNIWASISHWIKCFESFFHNSKTFIYVLSAWIYFPPTLSEKNPVYMWKKNYTTRAKTEACLQGQHSVDFWEPRFQDGSHHSLIRMAHVPKWIVPTIWFILKICFLLGVWTFYMC